MEQPKDIKKKGKIWKLKKPLYGLNDASRKFRLKVREVSNDIGLKILKGDEAFYHRHDVEGNLDGMVSSPHNCGKFYVLKVGFHWVVFS